MKIEFEGGTYDLDTDHIGLKRAMEIQAFTGMSIGDWADSLDFKKDDEGKIANPPPEWLASVAALFWLMLAQNGDAPPLAEVDFDFQGFLVAYYTALLAQAAAAAPEPPLPPTTPSQPEPPPVSTASATPTGTIPPAFRRGGVSGTVS